VIFYCEVYKIEVVKKRTQWTLFPHFRGFQKRKFSQSTLEVNDRETTAKIEITAVRRENDVKFAITASAVVVKAPLQQLLAVM